MHLFSELHQNGIGLLWAIFIFSLLVFIHEFGHFLMAKRVGIKVQEFSIGFGPSLFRWKKNETEYSLRLFPLGGYVKMLDGEEEAESPANFQNKKFGEKIAVVGAGPAMNYLLAIFLFLFLGLFVGTSVYTFKITAVIPNMPAARAGLKAGDEVLSINHQRYENPYNPETVISQVVHKIWNSSGVPLHFEIKRGENIFSVTMTPVFDKERKVGLLGVRPTYQVSFRKQGVTGSLKSSLLSTWYFTKAPLVQIEKIFEGQITAKELARGSAGPVGIASIIVSTYNHHQGGEAVKYLLWLAALLNIFIGLFNLFPIPALDGSRIFFITLGRIFGKPLSSRLEERIHLVGFGFLLILVALITYQDILRVVMHKGF